MNDQPTSSPTAAATPRSSVWSLSSTSARNANPAASPAPARAASASRNAGSGAVTATGLAMSCIIVRMRSTSAPRPSLGRSSAHPGGATAARSLREVGRTVLQRAERNICIRTRSRPAPDEQEPSQRPQRHARVGRAAEASRRPRESMRCIGMTSAGLNSRHAKVEPRRAPLPHRDTRSGTGGHCIAPAAKPKRKSLSLSTPAHRGGYPRAPNLRIESLHWRSATRKEPPWP
jgi:hypothetical protein